MSKLEEQKALPRRKLFKDAEPKLYFIDIEVPKRKRKAKKAKGKR